MTAELIVTSNTLAPLARAQREAAVTAYLTTARDRLAMALDATGPEQVAALKAEIATAAEATKQLHLSKEIQLDAQEMVRRAEYALGKAIRQGQKDGTVGTRADNERDASVPSTKASPSDFAKDTELYDRPSQGKAGILGLADDATGDEFDRALTEAKAEGNLSRANVSRKIKQQSSQSLTGDARLAKISELAAKGHSSAQIAAKLGHTEEYTRKLARDNDIEIPADKVMGRQQRIDHTDAVERTVNHLDDFASTLHHIDLSQVDPTRVTEWVTSIDLSIRAIRKFQRQIRDL